jgi:hypothetical protein
LSPKSNIGATEVLAFQPDGGPDPQLARTVYRTFPPCAGLAMGTGPKGARIHDGQLRLGFEWVDPLS